MAQNKNNVMEFAQAELNKYWRKITGENASKIKLNVSSDRFDIKDLEKVDAYCINVDSGDGEIFSSNERSALLAVYRFVQEIGVRFLYPTEEAEVIPNVNKKNCNVHITETASYEHRGICIEGAVSLEHVINIIDWSAKIGFNTYFIQFREAHNFFERWYKHENNPFAEPEEYSVERSREYVNIIVNEIKKRGMIYHAVGHGWTCESLGIPSFGWYNTDDGVLSEENHQYLAMIDGKRGFFKGIPLNTHLCYSNEKVQEMFVNEVTNYILSNEDIDIIHVWLADACNNLCECEECQKTTVSDAYVKMLNKIDEKLCEAGNESKIVFLIYLELLSTPEHERLINKDRFIMMFAPIHRTYTKAYLTDHKAPKPEDCKGMEFNLNKVKFPTDINTNIAFLYEWEKIFDGDSFLFDYHLMWDIYRDFASIGLSKVIYDDIVALDELKLNGLISCQLQRAFFPNALSMYVMGKTLFNKTLAYDDIVNEYMLAAYGKDYKFVLEYLQAISKLFSHAYARGDLPLLSPAVANDYKKGVLCIEINMPKLKGLYSKCKNENQKQMFLLLVKFSELMSELGVIMAQKASGARNDELKDDFEKFKNNVWRLEPDLNMFMDSMFFVAVIAGIVEDVR